MQIVIVTGLSGAGKSTALRALEDIHFYCVDNLPLPLVPRLVEQVSPFGIGQVALSDDVLLRRYSETRRRHPLSGDELSDGIHRDRESLAILREEAAVVNTGPLNV